MAIKSRYLITASRRDLIYNIAQNLQNHHVFMSAKRTFLSISIIKKVTVKKPVFHAKIAS